MEYPKAVWAILKKDIISELRTKEMLAPMFLFVVSTMVIFNYAFKPDEFDISPYVGGLLWLAILFTSLLGLNRSFVHEKDEGCLEGLLLSPIDRPAIYLGKMLGNLIFIIVVEVVALPLFTVFFVKTSYLSRLGPILLVIFLGNLGVSAIGTLFATISVNTKLRDLLLPILILPFIVPLLIVAVDLTGKLMSMAKIVGFTSALNFLIFYDIIFLLASFGLYDYVIGE